MLRVTDLSKVYDGNVVLRSINLVVENFVGIHGPNGSGKSTLLNVIAGIEKPTCGRVIFEDEDITGLAAEKVARRGIAIVFQIPRPFKKLTVVENLTVASLMRRNREEAIEQAYRICSFVGLEGLEKQRAKDLSQGELRLLEIGKALATEPKLLLLDEPFSGLDVENARKVRKILLRVKKMGIAAIITAHRIKPLREIADICYEMRGGRLAES